MVAPVYVTGRQVDARARFRLGMPSSVSVLPESATLTVSVNGADVKAVPVGVAYGLRVTEFDIPAGLLRPGWNAVGIAAHHRHRVDCSVGAADELWTRVDPAETGFMFADAAAGFPDLADIAAIRPRPDGDVGDRAENEVDTIIAEVLELHRRLGESPRQDDALHGAAESLDGHKRHFLPLSGFRPGPNRVELRVNAPDVPGVGCDAPACPARREFG
jgi:Bacterial cellulose synthase subunit